MVGRRRQPVDPAYGVGDHSCGQRFADPIVVHLDALGRATDAQEVGRAEASDRRMPSTRTRPCTTAGTCSDCPLVCSKAPFSPSVTTTLPTPIESSLSAARRASVEDLAFLPVTALAPLVRRRDVSSTELRAIGTSLARDSRHVDL